MTRRHSFRRREGDELGIDLARSVHGAVEIVHHRPVCAGETLHGRVVVRDIQEKKGARGGKMTFVEVEASCATRRTAPRCSFATRSSNAIPRDAGEHLVDCQLVVVNQEGESKIMGDATVLLPSRSSAGE